MLLTLICLVAILLLTAYLATQGALSAILVFAAALFGGLAAMGTYEMLAPLMYGWRPEFAHGVVFLGVYFLAFSLVRLVLDFAVPKNVILPTWGDRIGGGVIGFFAAMLVVGTAVTGMEMLPLPESAMGGTITEESGQATGRTFAAKFATGVFYLASGHGFGGNSLATAHPDLGAEITGYRHTVEAGSLQAMVPDLLEVKGPFVPAKTGPAVTQPATPGNQIVVIRTSITKGTDQPKVTWDADAYLRLTTTQVRLVTQREDGSRQQYYPIGFMAEGRKFEPLPLGTGNIVSDYNKNGEAVFDWVFELEDGARPKAIEVKRGGRKELDPEEIQKSRPYVALAASNYPPRPANVGTLAISVKPAAGDLVGATNNVKVYVVRRPQHRMIKTMLRDAHNAVQAIAADWDAGKNGWGSTAAGKPGVPDLGEINRLSRLVEMVNAPDDDYAQMLWSNIIQMLLTAQEKPDGRTNLNIVPTYFREKVEPILKDHDILRWEATTNTDGKVEPKAFPSEGSYTIIIVQTPENTGRKAFRVWIKEVTLKKGETLPVDNAPDANARNARPPEFAIVLP